MKPQPITQEQDAYLRKRVHYYEDRQARGELSDGEARTLARYRDALGLAPLGELFGDKPQTPAQVEPDNQTTLFGGA